MVAGALLAAVVVGTAGAAHAHISLTSPPSRYGPSVLKFGPCGMTDGTRSQNVTIFTSGATIEVVWDEYINHPGHFRISFDGDGDDDFVDPACLSGCDTTQPEIETYSNGTVLLDAIPDAPMGGEVRATVTLPDIECDNCTLQLIQVMYDKPPYEAPGNDIYYQCADLVLIRGGDAGPGADGGSSGGCSVVPEPRSSPVPAWIATVMVAAWLAHRRRARCRAEGPNPRR